MTQRNINTIIAALALGAPMVLFSTTQAGAYGQSFLSPSTHSFARLTNVACQWVRNENGEVVCLGSDNSQNTRVAPHK